MGYGITGWKMGGRQSITQNLNPGQFRGMGKPHYKSSVFVQNNYYGNMGASMMYDNHCCGCNDGGGSNKFMNWMLGLGMFGNMLSGILGALGLGGDNSTETTNTTNTTNTTTTTTSEPKDKDEFEGLKTGFPEGKFFKVGDKYCCNLNGVTYDADSINGLYEQLKNAGKTPTNQTTEVPTEEKVEDGAGNTGGAGNSGAVQTGHSTYAANGVNRTKGKGGDGCRLNMVVATTTRSSTGTATVVTPDGKTHKVNVNCSGTIEEKLTKLSGEMQKVLKEAGYENVVLQNTKFNWASDGNTPTDKVSKPKTGTIDKTAKRNLTISFAVRSGGYVGNSGSATVTTPDGKIHQVTTGMSLTPGRARTDLANQMKELLKNEGWTNVTLQNSNFDDWQ